jgi:hypothetical protein
MSNIQNNNNNNSSSSRVIDANFKQAEGDKARSQAIKNKWIHNPPVKKLEKEYYSAKDAEAKKYLATGAKVVAATLMTGAITLSVINSNKTVKAAPNISSGVSEGIR